MQTFVSYLVCVYVFKIDLQAAALIFKDFGIFILPHPGAPSGYRRDELGQLSISIRTANTC